MTTFHCRHFHVNEPLLLSNTDLHTTMQEMRLVIKDMLDDSVIRQEAIDDLIVYQGRYNFKMTEQQPLVTAAAFLGVEVAIKTYTALLDINVEWKDNNHYILAILRNYIAKATGRTEQEVHEKCLFATMEK